MLAWLHRQSSKRGVGRMCLALLAMGLVWRTGYCLWNYPPGGDETFVAISILTRDFGGMLEPLDYGQVAPLAFMWLELAAKSLLGPSQYSLRLTPLLFALGGLLLFCGMSKPLVSRREALLGLGFIAASHFLACIQIKPYALDTFFAALITLCLWKVDQDPASQKGWLALIIASAVSLPLSYPSVFVAGGGVVFLGWTAYKRRNRRIWKYLLIYAAMVLLVWAAVFWLLARPQTGEAESLWNMKEWQDCFFPWQEPWSWPGWFIRQHTGNMMSYPMWDDPLNGKINFVLISAACISLLVKRRGRVLALLLAPLLPALVAAGLRMYPYGGSSRTMLYMAPAFCLLAGTGLCILIKLILPKRWSPLGITLAAVLFFCWSIQGMLTYQGPFRTTPYHKARDAMQSIAAAGSSDDVYCIQGLDKNAPLSIPHSSGVEPAFRFHVLSLLPGKLVWEGEATPKALPKGRLWLLASRNTLLKDIDESEMVRRLTGWHGAGLSLYSRVFEASPYWRISAYAAQGVGIAPPPGYSKAAPDQPIMLRTVRPLPAWRNPKWVQASPGHLPHNLLLGGKDGQGNELGVCRAAYRGGMHPGTLGSKGCRIGWGEAEVILDRFEVLTASRNPAASADGPGFKIGWKRHEPGSQPGEYFDGGKSAAGAALPVCRAYHAGGVWIGKKNGKYCNFPSRGKELVQRNYEVLVKLP